MNKNYESPEITITEFIAENIITTSGVKAPTFIGVNIGSVNGSEIFE